MQKIKCWIVNVLFVVFFTVTLLFCIGKGEKATCIVEVGADSGVEFVQLFYSESMSNTFSEEKSITVDEREKGDQHTSALSQHRHDLWRAADRGHLGYGLGDVDDPGHLGGQYISVVSPYRKEQHGHFL